MKLPVSFKERGNAAVVRTAARVLSAKGRVLLAVLFFCLAGTEASSVDDESPDMVRQRSTVNSASSIALADGVFEKKVVLALKLVPYGQVYQAELSAKDRAYLCSIDGGGPRYIATDGAGNIYLTFGFLPEIRKYDREGHYIETYIWEVPRREAAVWQILVGENDESVYVFGGAGWQRKCKKFTKHGQVEWLRFNEYLEKRDVTEDGGGLVLMKTGRRIAGSGGRDDDKALWRRAKGVELAKKWNDGQPVFKMKGSGLWFWRKLDHSRVGADISDGYVKYVDREGCIFVLFSARDPSLKVHLTHGRIEAGTKWWVAKYDPKGRYIGSLSCETAPLGPTLAFTSGGEVLEVWSDGKACLVSKWVQR